MSEIEQDQVDETRFDRAALRRTALEATRDWMLADDVQGEVIAGRERANIDRPHVPIQVVVQVLDALVEDGRLERQEGDLAAGAFLPRDGGELIRYRRKPEDRGETLRRRAAILRYLFPPPGDKPVPVHALTAGQLVAALAAESIPATERVVLEDLSSLGNDVGAEDVEGEASFALREKAAAEILAAGAHAVAARTWPEEGTEGPALVSGAVFQQQVTEELSAARSARAKAELERDKLADFLREKDISVEDVLGRKPAPLRKTFVWTQARPVDMAEKGLIFEEVRKLEASVKEVELQLDGAKARAKAARAGLEEQIQSLKDAADCNQRVLSVLAYRETDWDAKVDVIRAADDDRELERTDIVRGTQKTLPGVGAPARADGGSEPVDSEDGPVGEAPPEGPQPLLDVRAAVLEVTRAATGPVLHDDLNDAIRGLYVCPEGFEALVKMEVAKLVKEGALRIVQGKPPRFALPTEKAEKKAAPSAPTDGDDEDDDDRDDGEEDEDLVADSDDDAEEPPPPPPAKKGRRKKNPRTGQVSP